MLGLIFGVGETSKVFLQFSIQLHIFIVIERNAIALKINRTIGEEQRLAGPGKCIPWAPVGSNNLRTTASKNGEHVNEAA